MFFFSIVMLVYRRVTLPGSMAGFSVCEPIPGHVPCQVVVMSHNYGQLPILPIRFNLFDLHPINLLYH